MSGIKDTATVTLNVNGSQAKQMMADLEAKIQQTEVAISQLKQKMADPKDVARARKQLKSYQKQLDEMKSATEGVNKALDNLDTATPRQLEKALRTLNRQLKDMTPGTEVWQSHIEKIQELKTRLGQLKEEVNGQESAWGRFKNWSVSAWPALDLIKGWYGEMIGGMRECVDAFASMDQEMANVRKFTGMTEEEVAALNEEFKKIDTRTSREQLNVLAQEAGRLGKTSQEDVLGFVRAADQINVALDDLGEGATLTLSKLTGIFGDEDRYGTEQSLLKVGSVINELSQNCSASAPYLAQFAERMGGVGAQAGLTIQQIMGLGAVLDSNSQAVEASATAVSQVLVRMMQDPAKYAKVAGLEVESFAEKLRTYANGALLDFLEALNKAGGMDVLSPMFKDMGENGSRAIAALSTLATNIDAVKAQQEAANKAFDEGTSVTAEFNVQNNTVQAALEKCKNAATELRVELGKSLYPIMKYILVTGSSIIRALLTTINFVKEHKGAVAALAAAITAYTVVVNFAIIKDKVLNALRSARIALSKAEVVISSKLAVVTEGLRLVYFRLTGQVQKAMVAQKAFSAAMAATPWGAILTAIASAITAFKLFDDQVEKTTNEYEHLDKAKEDAAVKYNEEKYLLDQNIKKLQEFSGSKEQEQTLINQLNEKYGPILGTYSSLSDWLKTLTNRGNDYCLSLQQQIVMEGKLEQARQLIAKAAKMRIEGDGEEYTYGESFWNFLTYNLEELKWLPSGNVSFKSMDEIDQEHWKEYWDRAEKKAQQYEAQAEALRASAAADAEAAKANFKPVVVTDETHTPYKSQVLADKEQREIEKDARQRALAERRALAMAKKEFQDKMEGAKADYEFGSAQNIMAYGSGLKSYEDYLAEKERLDLQYVDDRIAIYQNLYAGESENDRKLLLMYDEDYQSFLLKKAELTNKFSSEQAKRSIADLKRDFEVEKAKLEFEFYSPSSEYYGDSRAQQERLHQLKIDYLIKYRDIYQKNSKEWLQYQAQIDEAEQEHMLEKRKELMASYEAWAAQYTNLSAKKQYEIEVGIVKKLYEQKKITEEQYQIWLAQLREKYNSESSNATSAATKSKYEVAGPGGNIDIRSNDDQAKARAKELKDKRDSAIGELRKRFEGGLINQEEFNQGLKNIRKGYEENLLDPVRQGLDEQTRMLFDLGVAWYDFFKGISETGKLSFEDIKEVAIASLATMTAGLQVYSQFVDAEKRIELAAVEKRYDREIKMAQGNSYKVAKAEKRKEDEIAKIKAEYAKKEFAVKVIMGVAQTAQNALLGYAAGLQAGFPMATWLAPLLAGMAVAQGAIQIALLKKQQQAAAAEGYSKGGFTKKGRVNEPAGIVHAGEWVASQKLLASPVARPMIDALDHAQRTNTIGSLQADDVSRSITANNSLVRIAESDGGSALLVAAASEMSRTVATLNDRLREPFVTVNTVSGDRGIKQAQDDYNRLMNNVTPKSKRKP